MTEALVSSNHRKPNLRHFYAYQKDGVFQSGLKLDYVRLTNTVMAPREEAELDEDIRLIRTGVAKCQDLFYLDTRNFTSLTLRIALSLAIIVSALTSIAAFFSGELVGKPGWSDNIFLNILIVYASSLVGSLLYFIVLIFILSAIIKYLYFLLGITRFRVLPTIFNITLLLTLFSFLSLLVVYLFNPPRNSNIFQAFIGLIIFSIVFPGLTTFLSSINIRNHRRIKVETEWRVNGRVYGEHLNQDNIPVLYPKRARDFYPLNPMEYRSLIAYQTAQGDRKQVKQLLKVWRTKPVVVEEDARLFARQNSNLLRRLGIFLFRITASLLAMFLGLLGRSTHNKILNALAQWLKIRGINRIYWIYQECEAALKRLVAMQGP